MGSLLTRLANAYLTRERARLGIPQAEQAAQASTDASLLRRAQAARIAQELELAPAEQDLKSRLTEAQIRNLDEPNRVSRTPIAGSFEDYMTTNPERRREIEAARKAYGQADDRPHRPSIALSIPVPVLDTTTRDITYATREEIIGNRDRYKPAPTAEMRNVQQRQAKTGAGLKALDVLGEQLITEHTALAQRLKATGQSVEAALQNNPKFRAYQDSRRAMAINLAAIMNQGRPTEPDAQAAADIIPNVFSDTPESAQIKRDFIQQMLASPDEARDMLVEFKLKYGSDNGSAGSTATGPGKLDPAVQRILELIRSRNAGQ